MWKDHRHDAFSARQPLTAGPRILPTEASTRETYLGRCLAGTMLQKTTRAMVMMPPPSTLWMQDAQVVGDGAEGSAKTKQDERRQQLLLPAERLRDGCVDRLADGRGKEVRGVCLEGVY